MAYEKRDNSGSLFINKRKNKPTDANLSGSIMINGQEYWINGWTKTKEDGEKWISLSTRPKEAKTQAAATQSNVLADDADIPF